MEKKPQIRDHYLHIRLTESEIKKINAGFSNSTKRTQTEYIRSILLEKPITIYTRNKSLDEFLEEIILLRKELISIGNNFNQSVRKLHMTTDVPEIKTWAILNESSKQLIFKKIEDIEDKIIQIDNKWSQE